MLRKEPLGPGTGFIVQVPIEALRQVHALRGLQTQRVHIGDEHEKASQRLLGRHAELGSLFDGVDGVATGVGQTDDLGTGGLGLEQERRKIRARERVAYGAHHFATIGLDHGAGVFFQSVAKGIVCRQEEPLLPSTLGDGLGCSVGHGIGVVGPMHGHVVAVGVGHGGRCSARNQRDAVLFLGDLLHGQCHRGRHQFGCHIHLVSFKPFARLVGGNIGLVLVVCGDHFHLETGLFGGDEILNGHLGRDDSTRARHV